LRYENWKFVFEEQRATGTLRIWAEPFTKLRVPKLFDLRSDPYERADVTSNTFYDFFLSDGAGPFIASQAIVAPFLATFKEFPPSQRHRASASTNLSKICRGALSHRINNVLKGRLAATPAGASIPIAR
jgi:hypothetical protein